MLELIELIHDSGLVYNDLKPDNVLINFDEKIPEPLSKIGHNIFKNVKLNLIDFGLASEWRDSITGKHKK